MNQIPHPAPANPARPLGPAVWLPGLALLASLSGCRVVGDIFKVGVGVGAFVVVLAVAIVAGIIGLVRRS